MKAFLVILVALSAFFMSCSSEKKVQQRSEQLQEYTESEKQIFAEEAEQPENDSSPEDFKIFYLKFLKDESFQLSRITFPVDGEIFEEGRAIYNKIGIENWEMMRGSVYDVDTAEYSVEVIESPTDVYHRIYIQDSGVDIVGKYKRIDNKWYLIYYKSMFF